MKKILLSMLGAIVALTSCQKDDLSSSGDGREVAVSIAASLPTTMTRSSEQGGIDNVDWTKYSLRYTLEIYDGENLLPVSKENGAATQRVIYKDSKEGAKAATFETIRLLSGKDYQFVIWADFVTRTGNAGSYTYTELLYTTQEETGLKCIKRGNMTFQDCNEVADAYFASEKIEVTGSVTKAITLKRPFGKLRIITTDIKDIVNATVTEETPVTVKIDGGIHRDFNAYDGTIPGGGGRGFDANYTTTIKELTNEQGTLFFDYYLVPTTSAASPVQVPFHFTVECLGAKFEMTTDAVKLERNKLTTVKGKLLTKGVDVSVTITDEFDTPSIEFEVPVEAPTLAAAQAKLNAIDFEAQGRPAAPISVSITNAVANDTEDGVTLALPSAITTINTPQIQIDLAAGIASGSTFTLKQTTTNDQAPAYTGKVYVTAPSSDAGSLVLDMPSATVYVNGKIKQLTSTVSKHTLIIEPEAVIETLTLDEGNTIIRGKVTNLNFTKALFEKECVLPPKWNCQLLKDMRTVKVYGNVPLIIANSNIDGIATDSIPAAIYFNYVDNADHDIMFYPGFWLSKQQMKTPWFGDGTMPDEVNWPVVPATAKRSSFAAPLPKNYATRSTARAIHITTDFPINQPTTLPGDFSFSGAGRFVVNAEFTLNGSTLDATNNIGIAPITIRSSNVTFTGNNITLIQKTSGNGDGTASSGLGIVVEAGSSINNVKINLTDSHLKMDGPRGYQRAIVFPTAVAQTGMEVNLLRTDITCLTTTAMKNASYSQGIGIGALTNPKVTLTDCDLTGMYYAINNPSSCPTNMELTIDNSRLSGYGALNLRGSSTIRIVNNSVLTGRNFYPAGSNVFAAIVYNAGTINAPSTLLVNNSTIQNTVTNTSAEYMIDVRNNSSVAITLQNNTKLFDKPVHNGVNIDFMIKDLGAGSTVTADATTILDGKTGVTLTAQ